MQERHEQAAFQDDRKGDAWRYVLAWAYVCGYTLRMVLAVCWGLLCLAPWVPIVAIVLALFLALK